MSEWVAIALILAVVALIAVVLWFAWRHRGGRAAQGIVAAGTRYNDYFRLGAHPEIPSEVSAARGERSREDVTEDSPGSPVRRRQRRAYSERVTYREGR